MVRRSISGSSKKLQKNIIECKNSCCMCKLTLVTHHTPKPPYSSTKSDAHISNLPAIACLLFYSLSAFANLALLYTK